MNYIEIRRSKDFGHVDKEEKLYCHYLYYIAAPRARLIKNLSSPTRCPEKEKSASESSRAFQYIIFLQGRTIFQLQA